MRVPTHDHRRLYEADRAAIDAAIARVLTSGRLDWGEEVPAFEAAFAQWNGVAEAVTVNSGTAALKVALLALGIGPGDEVITVANTDIASSSAIRHTGAQPVFVDVDPVTRTIDVEAMKAAIGARTRAILPIDLYGHPAEMPAIVAVARRHGLAIVEDACIALGATIEGVKVGGFADATAYSFAPTKHLGAFGSGGAAVTNDPALAERMRKISAYGQERARHRSMHAGLSTGLFHETEGLNERLDEIQAAILSVKLRGLDETLATRRRQAALYDAGLAGTRIDLPRVADGMTHVFRNYVVELDGRDEFRQKLAAAEVASNLTYTPPMHLQPAYADLGMPKGSLPVSERSGDRLVGLPIGPHLDEAQIALVIEAARAAL